MLSIDDKILRASDVCELFPEKKLDLIRIFLNAIFYADRAQRILEVWEDAIINQFILLFILGLQ